MKPDTPGRGALLGVHCAHHRKLCTMQGSTYDSTLKLEVMWAVADVQCAECRLSVGKMAFYHASRCAVERT